MRKTPYLSVIVPAHNEGKRLNTCLGDLTSYLWNYTHAWFEIIVVCNGCTDDTPTIASWWEDEWAEVRTINLSEAGKGRAVRAGMLAASGRYCYMADVDLSTPPEEIQRFLDFARSGFDVVIGTRTNPQLVKQSPRRALAGKIFHAMTSQLVPGIRDTQCGFKMFNQAAALNLFYNLQTTGWAFDVEILRDAQRRGYRIHQYPVPWKEGQESKVRLVRDSLKMVVELARIAARPVTPVRTPVHV